MRIFLTGATGFIGSHVLPRLLAAGHEVIGNARSEEGARRLEAAGAAVHRGDLNDPAGLAKGAERADAVIHTAFDHEFVRMAENCQKDRRVIRAIGEVLAGSNRTFLITSGVGLGSPGPGQLAREDVFDRDTPIPRVATELAGEEVAARGVSVGIIRLPQVHDPVKQGLITPLIAIAKQKGRSAYVGAGDDRWAAGAVDDVADLYVRALERHEPGARWHAVAEAGVPMRRIAETIATGLGIPAVSLTAEQAQAHFGWMAAFMSLDMAASNAITRERLDWTPTGPTLIDDLGRMDYSAVAAG